MLVIFLGKKASRKQRLALGLSYLGIIVAFGGDVTVSGPQAVLGAALVFASAVSYAVYLVMSGEAVQRLGAPRITGAATSIACVLCIAQFFILRKPTGCVRRAGSRLARALECGSPHILSGAARHDGDRARGRRRHRARRA